MLWRDYGIAFDDYTFEDVWYAIMIDNAEQERARNIQRRQAEQQRHG